VDDILGGNGTGRDAVMAWPWSAVSTGIIRLACRRGGGGGSRGLGERGDVVCAGNCRIERLC